MNYEKKAEEITIKLLTNNFTASDTQNIIETALREAAGEKVEHEFKAGDHVLVSDGSDEPTSKAVYLESEEEGTFYVYREGYGPHIHENCIPDPEFSKPLYFKPVVEGQKFKNGKYYFLYSDGCISKSLSKYSGAWIDAKSYAVIPEGWDKK